MAWFLLKFLKNPKRVEITGNPIRKSIVEITKDEARKRLGLDDKKTVLVFGGSLGADYFNSVVCDYISEAIKAGKDYRFIMSAGKNNRYEKLYKRFEENGVNPDTCENLTLSEYKSRKFCNNHCSAIYTNSHRKKKPKKKCKNCGKEITKTINKRNKTGNYFCNSSCAATYNNTHKTKGVRRSKLELWIESKLSELYPNLEILYCDKTTINSELDIYIPSLKLAIELNGIYHYEPIHRIDKLNRIQNNDANKFQLCLQHGISMCIIDTSSQKYFKESSSIKFLNIITEIINKNL